MAKTAKQEIITAPQRLPVERVAMTPLDMLNAAVEGGRDIEVIGKLMDLHERWEKGQARKAFDEAIADAKAELPPIVKNREGHNNAKYADFAALAKAVDPVLAAHGLSYRFRTVQTDRIAVTCVISHKAGHFEENTLSGPSDTSGNKNAIQAIGSTLTYLQRYSLVQALGLAASIDDDGKAAANSRDLIDENQVKTIQQLIVEVGADIPAFLKYMQVGTIGDIQARYFDAAMSALRKKAKANG